jgi:phage baseplate assembly protein W
MGHSQFNFKSSGVRTTDRRFTKAAPSTERPIGFKTPLEQGDDIFKMHTSPIRQLTDNFRNLIMTNNGERLGMFNFGANLNSVVFEYGNSPNFEQAIGEAIINVTQKFIPSISIIDISSVFIDEVEKNDANKIGLAKVRIRIEYVIPKFKSPKLAIEVDLNLGG